MAQIAEMKSRITRAVRFVHSRAFLRELPRDLCIYFHDLPRSAWSPFSEAMDFFLGRGYRTVTANELTTGSSATPRLFVSFDDNFEDWHRALGLLDNLRVKATFYVNTCPIRDICTQSDIDSYFSRIRYKGDSKPLSRSQIVDMRAAGHQIGCHSHSHLVLSKLPQQLWDQEIRGSRRILEDILSQRVKDFSYPFGMRRHFSAKLLEYCRVVGFETIVTAIPALQHQPKSATRPIHRSPWALAESIENNLINLRIDGSLFERFTGRSAVG